MQTVKVSYLSGIKTTSRKLLAALLAFLILTVSMPPAVFAAEYVPGVWRVTATSLTIRAGSNSGTTALGYLSNGDEVTITKVENDHWGYFTHNGITGWASMAYMELVKAASSSLAVGDKITINAGATSWGTNNAFASFVYSTEFYVIGITNDGQRVVFGNAAGAVTGATDISNVTKCSEKTYYAKGDNKIYAWGIDVSKWQAGINWTSVAADNVDFAILRAGVVTSSGGSVNADPYFEANYSGCKANGIDVGVYIYGCAVTEAQAIAEADGLYQYIKGKTFEYPIFYDAEYEDQKSVGKAAMSKVIMAFINRMTSYGYYCGTYSGEYMLTSCMDTTVIGEKHDIWMAKYYNALQNLTPAQAKSAVSGYTSTYSQLYGMWQYSSTSSIAGINGNVDVDVAYKDFPAIIKASGLNGYGTSTPTAEAPTISTSNYYGGKKVTITTGTSGAKIYYTKDGSTPTASSTEYTGAFKVSSASNTIKAIAIASGYKDSSVTTKTFSISKTAAPTVTTADTAGGVSITLGCSTANAKIYYTTDGSTPTTSSSLYSSPFTLNTASTVINVLAVANGYSKSAVTSKTVSIAKVDTPVISTENIANGVKVTISCSTSGATVYYTTDGSTPTTSSSKYSAAFNLSSASTVVKAIAVKNGSLNSDVASKAISVSKVSKPVITLSDFVGGKYMALSCDTEGATVYYTTDGSTPTTESKVYTSKVKLTAASYTIKAYAVANGFTDSDILTQSFEIPRVNTPVIETKQNGDTVTVSISCTTDGATVYYTTDGTAPTTTDTVYSGPFTVDSLTKVTAIAVLSGYRNSAKATEAVAINVTSIVLDKNELSLNYDKTATITATVLPDNATDKTVLWSSSDPNVATVDNGVITAHSGGTANITAYTANGVSAVCKLTVIDNRGDYYLAATSADEITADGYYIFAVSDIAVGKISNNIAKGTAVTISDGKIQKTFASNVWIAEASGDGYFLKNAASGKYIVCEGGTAVTESDVPQTVNIALSANGFTVTHAATNRFLGYDGTNGYKWYAASNSKVTYHGYLSIYKYMNETAPTFQEEIPEYSVTVTSDGHGSVTPSYKNESIQQNTELTVTAKPNDGYIFSGWINSDSVIVSNKATYKFTVSSDINITAVFTQLKCGSVSSSHASGIIEDGSSITLTAADGETVMYSLNGTDYTEYTQPITPEKYPVTIYAYAARANYINGDICTFEYDIIHPDTGVYARIADSSYLAHGTKIALVYGDKLLAAPSGSAMSLTDIFFNSNATFGNIGTDNSWIIEQNGLTYYLKNASTGKYLSATSSGSITVGTQPQDFKITLQNDGTFLITHADTGKFLGFNGSDSFKLYSSSNISKYPGYLYIYVYTEGDIPECNLYSVTASASDNAAGVVTNEYEGKKLIAGTQVTVSAAANSGYAFIAWTDADGNVLSTSATYQFTLTADTVCIATFEHLKCGAVSANPNGGDISSTTAIVLTAADGESVMYSINGGEYREYTGPITLSVFPAVLNAYTVRDGYINGDICTFNYGKKLIDENFSGTFTKISDLNDMVSGGMYIIAANGNALTSTVLSNAFTSLVVSTLNDRITTDVKDIIWFITETSEKGVYNLMTADKKYLYGTSGSANVSLKDTGIDLVITELGNGKFKILQNNTPGRYLGYSISNQYFKWFTSTASTYISELDIFKYNPDADNDKFYNVKVSTDGNGDLEKDVSGSYIENSVISVTAKERENSSFDGWYDSDNKLVSNELTYVFTLVSDVEVTARFLVYTFGELNGDGNTDINDIYILLNILSDASSVSDKIKSFADFDRNGVIDLMDAYKLWCYIYN